MEYFALQIWIMYVTHKERYGKLQLLFSTRTLIHMSIAGGVTVGIELPTNRNIREDTDPTVEYCVVISVPDMNVTIQRSDFSVCVSTVDGTAVGENIDYIHIPVYNSYYLLGK